MNAFNIAIYASLFCAIAMILGGIWLLAKGAIKLTEAGKSEGGLSVELFNKIKVNTGYPALGFFLIALFLVAVAIWFSKPPDVLSLNVDGKLNIDGDPSELVTIKVVPSSESGITLHPDSDGSLTRTLHPEFALDIVINAAGYEPDHWKETISMTKGVQQSIPLPKDIKFTKAPIVTPDGGTIIALPGNVNAPPVQEAKGFKPSS
jgi:hypothetical protein